jgi:hypothetical protein
MGTIGPSREDYLFTRGIHGSLYVATRICRSLQLRRSPALGLVHDLIGGTENR